MYKINILLKSHLEAPYTYFEDKVTNLKKSLNHDDYEFIKVNITVISAKFKTKFNKKTIRL